ncbi:MAG: hypothetical protein K2J99_12640 [Lachnospiraceae bacterium]|nr:hypothetical protein [Lachnospiraceae bacterium]
MLKVQSCGKEEVLTRHVKEWVKQRKMFYIRTKMTKQTEEDLKNIDEYNRITNIVRAQGYDEQLAVFLWTMLKYMRNEHWRGACHAACSIMYVALSEMGYHVDLCLGEVRAEAFCFDHSWILLDGRIIDLTAGMILVGGVSVSAPIILNMDIRTDQKYTFQYGIYRSGLDRETEIVRDMPFVEYMDNYPKFKNGLWEVLAQVFPGEIDIRSLREKYMDVERHYICGNTQDMRALHVSEVLQKY